MAKVDQVHNRDSGKLARTKFNEALRSLDGESVGDLDDIDLSTLPELGQALVWNGVAFVPSTTASSSSDEITETFTSQRLNLFGQFIDLTTSDTYLLPLAASVPNGYRMNIRLPDTYATEQPNVAATGSDTIAFSGGSESSIIFDIGTKEIILVSNGINEWRL